MSKEFDNVLDECLERLLVKGETLERCLQRYPEQAANLKPLLQTALATRQAAAIQPRAEFKARARYQFRSALQEVASPRSRPFLGWLPQWATVAIMVLGVLMVGGGTIAAASYSMPDSLLHPVRLATEQVRLALTPSALGKAELHAELADRRVAEIIYIANKGKPELMELVTRRLDKHLVMIASLVIAEREEAIALEALPLAEDLPPPVVERVYPKLTFEILTVAVDIDEVDRMAELRIILERSAVNHPAVLRAVLETAPEAVRPALLRAIAVSEAGFEKALDALD